MSKDYMILGAGISGLAACRLLLKKNPDDHIYLVDKKKPDLSPNLIPFVGQNIFCLTEDAALQQKSDALVMSSGIPLTHPLVAKMLVQGKEVLSEADLAFRYFKGTAVGITGTNGKSTVTKLVAHLLNQKKMPCLPCGNYGEALCDAVLRTEDFSYLSVELSSYQLANSSHLRLDVGVFVNFASDHESWHGNTKDYFLAKWRILEALKKPDSCLVTSPSILELAKSYGAEIPDYLNLAIVCREDEVLVNRPSSQKISLYYWDTTGLRNANGQELFSWQGFSLEGAHNHYNASLAAVALCESSLNIPLKDSDFGNFEPLPYRYQPCISKTGFKAINDSKATNVDAVLAALSSTAAPVILMLGGISKGESFAPIMAHADKIQKLICFGASGQSIADEIGVTIEKTQLFKSLNEAMNAAENFLPKTNEVLLFSPGCASFDEFKNYNERGAYFSRRVLEL